MSYVSLSHVNIGSEVQIKEGGKTYTFVRIEKNEESGNDEAVLRVQGSSGREYYKPLGHKVKLVRGSTGADHNSDFERAMRSPAGAPASKSPKLPEIPVVPPPRPAGYGLVTKRKVSTLAVGEIFRWPSTWNVFEVLKRDGDEFKVKLLVPGPKVTTKAGEVLEWSYSSKNSVEVEILALIEGEADDDVDEDDGEDAPVPSDSYPVMASAADLREGDMFQSDGVMTYTVHRDYTDSKGVRRMEISWGPEAKDRTPDWRVPDSFVVKILSRKESTPTIEAAASTSPAKLKSAAEIALGKPTPKKAEEEDPMAKMSVLDYVKAQGITGRQIAQINDWRTKLGVPTNHEDHPKLRSFFFGAEELKLALATLLGGQHLILKGPKGSGKNTLAETCAFLLATPLAEIQGHAHLDGDAIIGHEVFKSHVRDPKDMIDAYTHLQAEGLPETAISGILSALGKRDEVSYLYGTVAAAARDGKFVVIDEANSVRPEALIITHSLRDDRRRLEIPGYGVVTAHPRFRMILTFNPGYAGTSELNEATADGFVPVYVPPMGQADFANLLRTKFGKYGLKADKATLLSGIFQDLLKKAGAAGGAAEISTRPVSVRAVLQAVELMWQGIPPQRACLTCFVGRTDEELEQKIVGDIVKTRIQSTWGFGDFFTEA